MKRRVFLFTRLPPVQVSAMYFPKVLLYKLFGREALSGQVSHSRGIGCQMERDWVVSSCRRASAHTRGGLSLQPLSQLADGSERALQLSEASGRQCFQTGKQGGMGIPALGVRQRPHLSSAAHTSCEVMG